MQEPALGKEGATQHKTSGKLPCPCSSICLFPQVRQWHHEEPGPAGQSSPNAAQPRPLLCSAPSPCAARAVCCGVPGPAAGSSHCTNARYVPGLAGRQAAPVAGFLSGSLDQAGIVQAGLRPQLSADAVSLPRFPCMAAPPAQRALQLGPCSLPCWEPVRPQAQAGELGLRQPLL